MPEGQDPRSPRRRRVHPGDDASGKSDHDEILALRLLAHQAVGHLTAAGIDDIRSPFDAHARHLTCRVGDGSCG
jgi:hypothetical protein